MATLINGDGNAAVYAAQDSDWFAGVEGNTTKILKVGAKMEYEIEDANTIAIKNGVLVTKEGRRVQIDAGAIDEFIIPTGTQGVTRYFIIGYHLYTDASSNQLCETFVQLMANGTDTIPEDTFRGGSTDVYVSLYRVKQDGITLDTIQSLLPEGVDLDGIGDEIDDIKDDIDQINSDLTALNTLVSGTSANDLKDAINSLTEKEFLSSSVRVGVAVVKPDYQSVGGERCYIRFETTSNTSYAYSQLTLICNSSGLTLSRFTKSTNGTSSSATVTLSSWELQYIKDYSTP